MPSATRTPHDEKKVDAVHRKRLLASIERMLDERTLKHQDESFVKESLEFLKTQAVDPDDVSLLSPAFQHRVYNCEKKLENYRSLDQHTSKLDDRNTSYLPEVGTVTSSAMPQPIAAAKARPTQEEDTISVEKLQLLMQEKKEIHERELQLEQAKKKGLLGEIVELTGALKESTLGISRTVKDQTQKLDLMKQYAGQNEDELQQQKKMLVERRKAMEYSLLASITMVLWVVALFALTYFVIRLFPKSSANNTCPQLG